MKHLAFVTTEFYPLTAGGIGRVLYNMIASMSDADRQRTVVLLTSGNTDSTLAKTVFPEVRFETLGDVDNLLEQDLYPPKHAYSDSEWHWRSVCVLRKLIKLEQSGLKFDYIEFPDWGGLGFAATQEKLFSDAFAETLLAVRLHCTEGVLHTVEARLFDQNALSLYDIERKALRDCDRVVAQLLPVGEYNRDIYGFDEAEWQTRLCLHPPPVLIDRNCSTRSLKVGQNTPIIFTSKFQQVKAPEVFVRACVGFMRLCPDYRGEVRFLAHNTDPESVAHVKTLIPEDLQDRFRFYESIVPHALREQLISEGVAVFPSRFESFCLAAYEASLLGSVVVLNGANPAFGDDTPWVDGNNCIKFGGTVESLVTGLQRLFSEQPTEMTPVRLPSGNEPWHMVRFQREGTLWKIMIRSCLWFR